MGSEAGRHTLAGDSGPKDSGVSVVQSFSKVSKAFWSRTQFRSLLYHS